MMTQSIMAAGASREGLSGNSKKEKTGNWGELLNPHLPLASSATWSLPEPPKTVSPAGIPVFKAWTSGRSSHSIMTSSPQRHLAGSSFRSPKLSLDVQVLNPFSNIICAIGIWGRRASLNVTPLPARFNRSCRFQEMWIHWEPKSCCCLLSVCLSSSDSACSRLSPYMNASHHLLSVIALIWWWPLLSPEAIYSKGSVLLKLEKLSPVSPAKPHRRYLVIPGDTVAPLAVICSAGLSDLLNSMNYSGHRTWQGQGYGGGLRSSDFTWKMFWAFTSTWLWEPWLFLVWFGLVVLGGEVSDIGS